MSDHHDSNTRIEALRAAYMARMTREIDEAERRYEAHLNAAIVRSAHYELQIAHVLSGYARNHRTPTLDSVVSHLAAQCAEDGNVEAAALSIAMSVLFEHGPFWMRIRMEAEAARAIAAGLRAPHHFGPEGDHA